MSLTAKENSGAAIEPIPAGVYVAVCYGLIDLGTHHSPTFGNDTHKALIQWEVPEVRSDFERDGKQVNLPRAISRRYTVSLSEKSNLRKDLESWRGRKFTAQELAGFDLKTVLGTACQLQIVHETNKEGKTFATIAAIMALPKGTPRPKPENPLAFFSFEEAGKKPELPAGVPEWIQKIIMESREWQDFLARSPGSASPAAPIPGAAPAGVPETEDNIPF
jgi:hypothetical protein